MLRIDADRFPPVPPESVPWGPAPAIAGAPFDFTAPRPVRQNTERPDPQAKAAKGYGHCFVRRRPADPGAPRTAVVTHEPDSGRSPKFPTTEPEPRVHPANRRYGPLAAARGRVHGRPGTVCLEAPHPPDDPDGGRTPQTPTTQPRSRPHPTNPPDDPPTTAKNRPHRQPGAVCLETPHPPDAPRDPNAPHEPDSRRTPKIPTTWPRLQPHPTNPLNDPPAARSKPHRQPDTAYPKTPHPDAPHRPEYPATVLRPGGVGRGRTRVRCPYPAGFAESGGRS